MDEREQIRTWRINNSEDDCWVGDGPLMRPEEGPILVVELEPILGLVELMLTEGIPLFPEHKKVQSVAGMATDFLIAHGRLKVDV